eukprot:1161556-Pelagomonas_calceolata.AAC.7
MPVIPAMTQLKAYFCKVSNYTVSPQRPNSRCHSRYMAVSNTAIHACFQAWSPKLATSNSTGHTCLQACH